MHMVKTTDAFIKQYPGMRKIDRSSFIYLHVSTCITYISIWNILSRGGVMHGHSDHDRVHWEGAELGFPVRNSTRKPDSSSSWPCLVCPGPAGLTRPELAEHRLAVPDRSLGIRYNKKI